MTDKEIEQALSQISTSETLKKILSIGIVAKESLDYINRLKTECNYWKAQFEFQAEQDKGALIGERQVRKETAKEILEVVGNIADGDQWTHYKDYMWFTQLCEKYGVEVD